MPERDFWQQSYDEKDWEKHADNVKALLTELRKRFSTVTWATEQGAETGERLLLTEKREGPDIKGWYQGDHLVSIEVSGSDAPNISIPPDPFLVRPGKLVESPVPLLFWMVYRKSTWVLYAEDVAKYRRQVVPKIRKGKSETYLVIPYWEGLSPEHLFRVISSLLGRLEPVE